MDGFTLDPDVGRFLHTHKDIRIPARGLIYSFNEANFNDYDEPVKKYLNSMKDFQNAKGQRYVNSTLCLPLFSPIWMCQDLCITNYV